MTRAIRKIQGLARADEANGFDIAATRLWAPSRRARPYTRSEVWFKELMYALRQHRTLRVKYFTLERNAATERDIDPYGLLVHEGAFYVVGFCHLRRSRRTFLVDRIVFAKATDRHFTIPRDFSLKDHFKDAWNIIRDQALVTVKVRFNRSVARIIEEGRWHDSQKLERLPDGSVLLTARVSGWEEIKRWILAFGPAARVLDPPDLIRRISQELSETRQLYAKKSQD
jgi:predicted DNA-binding transcriptional regulator YafY